MIIFGYEVIVRKAGAAVEQEAPLFDIARVTLNPGDRVVLTTPYYVPAEMADMLMAQWDKFCPDTKAIVLADGLKLGVLGQSNTVVH